MIRDLHKFLIAVKWAEVLTDSREIAENITDKWVIDQAWGQDGWILHVYGPIQSRGLLTRSINIQQTNKTNFHWFDIQGFIVWVSGNFFVGHCSKKFPRVSNSASFDCVIVIFTMHQLEKNYIGTKEDDNIASRALQSIQNMQPCTVFPCFRAFVQ